MSLINSYDGLMDNFKGKSLYPIYKVINDKNANWEKDNAVLRFIFPESMHDGFGYQITDEIGSGDFAPTGEGNTYKQSTITAGYSSSYEFVEWTNKLEITKRMMEDNKTSSINKKAGVFGVSETRTREKFRSALLGGAKTAATVSFGGKSFSTASADGKALFATDHTGKDGLVQSNKFANALDATGFGKVITAMQNFKDDKSDEVMLNPNTIIIGNYEATKKSLFDVIGGDKNGGRSANDGYNYLFGNWRVIVSPLLNPYLSAGEYIVCDSGYNEDAVGATFGNRVMPEFETDVSEATRNFLLFGRSVYTAGFHDWKAFAVGGVSGATTIA
jgi:hypothetical protein